MKKLIAGIKRLVIHTLNLDLMGESFRLFAASFFFLMFYTTLETVFVNTLLIKVTGTMVSVFYYRAVYYTVIGIVMLISADLMKKINPITVGIMGCILYVFMYLFLIFGISYMNILMYVVAVITACACGLYYSVHNMLLPNYTTQRTRELGVGIVGVIQGVNTVICPLISGSIISAFDNLNGYRVMFILAILTVIVQIRIMIKLPKFPVKTNKSKYKITLKLFKEKSTYKIMLASEFIKGLRDGAFAFLLNIILFEMITSEFLVGVNTFLTGIMAILGSWVYGKIINRTNRCTYMYASITILCILLTALLFKMNPSLLILFTALNSFLQLFINHSTLSSSYDIVSQNTLARDTLSEAFGIREIFLNFGRVIGIFFIIYVTNHYKNAYIISMLILTFIQFANAMLVKLSQKILFRKQEMGTSE